MSAHYVNIIQNIEQGNSEDFIIKFGISHDPQKRLGHMKTQMPFLDLQLLYSSPVMEKTEALKLEKGVLVNTSEYSIGGEWRRLTESQYKSVCGSLLPECDIVPEVEDFFCLNTVKGSRWKLKIELTASEYRTLFGLLLYARKDGVVSFR